MGRMKIGMAVAAVVVTLVGVVAAVTLGSGGSTKVDTVASQAGAARSTPGAAGSSDPTAMIMEGQGSTVPATAGGARGPALPLTLPAHPTAEDVQRILAGITAQILAPPGSTETTKPLTKEQVESQVREQLKQLGINF